VSVINRVLQDLEQRHADGSKAHGTSGQVRAVERPQTSGGRTRALIGIAAVVAVGAGAWAWFGAEMAGTTTAPGIAVPPPPMSTATPAPTPTPMPTPAAVAPAPPVPVSAMPAEPAPPPDVRPDASRAPAPAVVQPPSAASPAGASARPTAAADGARPAPQPSAAASPAGARHDRASRARPVDPRREPLTATPVARGPEPAATSPAAEPVIAADPAASTSGPVEKRDRPASDAERAESLFRQATLALQQGRTHEAEARYAQAVAADPRHAGARQGLIGLMLESRRTAEAEQLARSGLELLPKQTGWALVAARLQADRGDTAGAVATLITHEDPARVGGDWYALRAGLQQRLGRHAEAADAWRAAIVAGPLRPAWYVGLGISLRELGRRDDARAAFERAAETDGLAADLRDYARRQAAALR
jgi:MSHA biogenesis protein MshN